MSRSALANPRRRQLIAGSAALIACGVAGRMPSAVAASATYPTRPISFICPWPVGGTADQSMRALCQAASEVLGQSVVLENKAGASGMIGTQALARAAADGYTIGQIPISVARFSQLGMLPLDPRKDFTYLARTSGQTFGIAVPAESRFQTLADVVAESKAKPTSLTYAHAGIGGATHVGMEEFALAAGIELHAVAYRGGAAALVDVLGGQVDMLADSSSWAPHVQSGKMRLLATWGEQRPPRFAEAPTLRELGYDVVVQAPNGVGAPAGMDPAIAHVLRDAFRQAVASDMFRKATEIIDAPVMYLDGPDYASYVAQEYDRETVLIERLGLKALLQKG